MAEDMSVDHRTLKTRLFAAGVECVVRRTARSCSDDEGTHGVARGGLTSA